ncbi:MAG: hypothetical protein DRP54_04750 [Spirochaetes bacterium]|nr:MAG: hypothetical protein DRP54_04750 [Spirochaetota bacterium]
MSLFNFPRIFTSFSVLLPEGFKEQVVRNVVVTATIMKNIMSFFIKLIIGLEIELFSNKFQNICN